MNRSGASTRMAHAKPPATKGVALRSPSWQYVAPHPSWLAAMYAPAHRPPAASAAALRLAPARANKSDPAVPSAANASGARFRASRALHAAGRASARASQGRLSPNTDVAASSAMSPSASGRTKSRLMNSASSHAQKNADPTMILAPVAPRVFSNRFTVLSLPRFRLYLSAGIRFASGWEVRGGDAAGEGRGKALRECAGGGDEGVRQGALRSAGVRGVGGREVRGLTSIVGWSIEKQAGILIRGAGRLLHPSARSHLWRRGSPWRPGNARALLPLSVELRAPRRVGHRECGACGEGPGIGRQSVCGRLLRGCEACEVIGERAVPASREYAGRRCGMQRGICGSSEVVGRVLCAKRPCQSSP